MSESVEVIISADDQASKKFAQVAVNADKTLGHVKTVGERMKGSAAFGSIFAKMLGGSEIGAAIGQVGEATEKVNQFGHVAKMGGAGALVFKGGLSALAFTAGVQLGSAISNAIFDFEKFNRQIESSKQKIDEFGKQAQSISRSRFSSAVADIELIKDPEQKQAAIEQLTASTQREIDNLTVRVQASQQAVDEWAEAWKITGDRKGFEQQAQQQLDRDREMLDVAVQHRQALIDQAAARERNAAAAAMQAEAQREAKAEQGFFSIKQQLEEEQLLYTYGAEAVENYRLEQLGLSEASQEFLISMRQQNAELKKNFDARTAQEQKEKQIQATYEQTLVSLERQRIAIEQGTEAARRYELAQAGMSQTQADQIVMRERAIAQAEKLKQKQEEDQKKKQQIAEDFQREKERKDEERKQRMKEQSSPVEARESRLLAGRGAAAENMTRQLAEKQLTELQAINRSIVDQTKGNRVKLAQVVR